MSDDQVRVACPACGQRFRMDPHAVPAGDAGKSARCRGCEAPFVVLREGDSLKAVPKPEKPAPEPQPAASPTKGAVPVRTKKRRAPPRKDSTGSGRERDAGARSASASPPPEPALPPSGIAGTPFGIGDRLGRYEIEGVIARGGMGGIYKAYDPAANRHVALKVLVSSATDLDKMRFQREIQVQGNVQHPHIMPIFDSGMIGSTRYYTMELLKDPLDLVELTALVHGSDAAKDPKLRPLTTIEGMVRRVVLPACQAIHHANVNEGVLHRDLKPGNVLVDRNGLRTFVIDFGVSSLLEKKNARLAHLDRELPVPLSGKGISITGTLVFMPPEQARGEADRRGDVWALGALLHYLVTNQPPLQNAIRPVVSRKERIEGLKLLIAQSKADGKFSEALEFEEKLAAIVDGTERTVEDLRDDVLRGRYLPRPANIAKGLEAIIAKAMRPNPEERFRHALDLHDDLTAWLEGRPVRAMVRSSGAAGGAFYRTRLWLRRHKAWVAVLWLLAVGAFLAVRFWPEEQRVDTAAIAQAHMDAALTAETAGRRREAQREAREVLRVDPDRQEAFDLMARLDTAERLDAAVARARALEGEARDAFAAKTPEVGRQRLAALEEVLTRAVLPFLDTPESEGIEVEMRSLLAFARDEQPLRVTGAPKGCSYALYPVTPGAGPVRWGAETELPSTPEGLDPQARVRSGAWVLRVRRRAGEVLLPFVVEAGGSGATVACPVDPGRIDAASVYVGAGAARGPTGTQSVGPLLWDRVEVTQARYAAFLGTLPPDERRQRVPRMAGALGALGEPLWDRVPDGFQPPGSAGRRPVEGISLYDARAYAAFAKKRLPTAAEWAWAATGPDRRLCAVGTLRDVIGGAVHIDRPLAGVTDGRGSAADRSPFGIWDMAGNVAEFTRTLGTLRGESGWFVMGGSYLSPAAHALVHDARLVPGWMPQQGVGLRCVRAP